MTPEQWFENLAFYLVAAMTLGSALGVALARKVMHAACLLLPTLVGVAALFALLGGHLLFAIQIMVYVGAINVLIIFAVLLLQRRVSGRLLAGSQHLFAGVVGAGLFTLVLIVAAVFTHLAPLQVVKAGHFGTDTVAGIGELFLTRHLLAFELTGIVLLVALVGSIVLARQDPTPVPGVPEPEAPAETAGEVR